MPIDWSWPIARFGRITGTVPVGAGALVGGAVVITCAHVVREALTGSTETPGTGTVVRIDFPFANIYDLKAKVAAWFPEISESERRRDGSPSDLAVLLLEEPPKIETIEPCLIAETEPEPNLRFASQGFPPGYPNGAPAEGSLQGTDAGGWIDAVADTAFGHFIEPGFSGAPVFARRSATARPGDVIGLCVTADIGGKRVARLIPPAQLACAVRTVASPYRWLEHFTQRDVTYFFGREELTTELCEDLRRQRFLLLAGPREVGSPPCFTRD